MSEQIVDCPKDDCEGSFDAVEAAQRTNPACPHCGASWTDLHREVDPDHADPEDTSIKTNFDGSTEVVTSDV